MIRNPSRRSVLAGTGVAMTGLLGVGSQVSGDEHEIPVIIAQVNPEEETVILENIGNNAVDLGGYRIDWEHSDDQSQTDAFDQGVTIETGAQLVVWSGFQSTQIPEVEYDHQIANHDNGRINDDDPDVVALLSPGGEVVATSDGEIQPPEPEPPEDDDTAEEEPEEEAEESDPEEEPEEEHEIPVSIVSIDVELEHIVLTNEGNEDVDLSGYIVNYDWEGDQDQEDTIDVDDPDNAVIEAGGELVLHTGCTDVGADLMLGEFGNCQFDPHADGVGFDTVALLSPDGRVVDTHSEDEQPEEEEEGDPSEGIREYEATLTGEAHDVETDASGYAYFVGDSGAGEIEYSVEVDYLCNATQAHIHLGGADEDGPVVAWFYPEDGEEPELIEGRFDGVLADGTLTEDDFVGEWDGTTVEEAKAAFDEEEAYVNIHTEYHPGGEIRGQIGIVDSL